MDTLDDLAAQLTAAQTRIAALEADRDYWRRQHDLVMADWKTDCDAYEARLTAQPRPVAVLAAPAAPAPDAAMQTVLADLLRFYDPASGALHAQSGGDFLTDAFARASRAGG
jgi:hypothetical protein